jgi:hypothetical protein
MTRGVRRGRPLRAGSMKPPARLFKGYAIDAPMSRVFRERATCEQVDCADWRSGWMVRAELLDARMWAEIKAKRYSWRRMDVSPTERYIAFEPGQPCFAASTHTRLIRNPLFVEHGSAKWGRTGPGYVHKRAEDWTESFAEHQDKLAAQVARG